MATIDKRGDGWRAQVRRKGMQPKTRTFPTKAMAIEWANRIEREYSQREASGASLSNDQSLREVIVWYEAEVGRDAQWGRSKAADLKRLRGYDIAAEKVIELSVQAYVRHATERHNAGAGPATIGNDFVWIRQVLKAARAELCLPANLQTLDDAVHALRSRRLIAKPNQRDRRLSSDEEKALLTYFDRRASDVPMGRIVRFALLSARRQEEITRIKWADIGSTTAWLDDVKHPRKKVGNRREFRLLREAMAIVHAQPKGELVFPYNPKTIGTYFTNACKLLEIEDLTFHDLRHEATSRLFERGYSIQEVAQFTLHESWATLKRYTHLKPAMVPER